MSLIRTAAVFAIVIASALSMTSTTLAQNATTGEVKAAFLYNFVRFTEWPAGAFASSSAPLVIGIAGDEILRENLDYVIRGKVAGMHPLTTRNVKDAKDAAGLHLLYVGSAHAFHANDFISAVKHRPVLTVGDDDRFCERGGMINFLIVGNRVRFEVELDATADAGLKVSSRVLTLAKAIHGKSRQ